MRMIIGSAARLIGLATVLGAVCVGTVPGVAAAASGHVPKDTVMRELLRVQTDEYDVGRSISAEFPIWASPGRPDSYPNGLPYRVYGNDTVHVVLARGGGVCVHITNPLAKSLPHGIYYDEVRNRQTTTRPETGPCATLDRDDNQVPRHTVLRELDKAVAAEVSRVNGDGNPPFLLTAGPGAPGRYPSGAAYHVYGADSVHVAVKGNNFCVHISDPLARSLPQGAFYNWNDGRTVTRRPHRGLCATVR